jgi:hypothetical protein
MTSLGLTGVRSVPARSGPILMMAAAMVLLLGLMAAPALQAVVPWFAVLLVLELTPLMWQRSPDLFSPPVLTGIMAAIGTAASLAEMSVNGELTLKWVALTRPADETTVALKVLFALILGTVSYFVGYYTRLGIGLRRIFPQVRGLAWDRGRLLLVCTTTALIFMVAYAVFQARVGVSLFDVRQLGLGKQVWRDDPTMSWMTRGVELGFLPVLLLLSWTLAKKRGAVSLIAPGLVLLAVGLLSWRLGQRGTFAAVLVASLVMFHYHRVRVRPILFIAMCFMAITVGNVTLSWRTAATDEERTFGFVEAASDPAQLLANHESERSRFSGLALIMSEFPDNHPYLLGQSWASIIALPIPRWLWPDKVNHFEWQDNRIIMRLGGPPMPAPYVGALYANFSWPGIVLGMLLFGAFHRGQYEWLLANVGDQNVILLYALLLVYFAPSMLNISLCLQYAVPVWVVLRFVGRRPHAAGRAESLRPTPLRSPRIA